MAAIQMICPRLIAAMTGIEARELVTLLERPDFPIAVQGTPEHPSFDLAQIERWFAGLNREFRYPNAFERVVMVMEATTRSPTRRDFARLVRGPLRIRRVIEHAADAAGVWDEHHAGLTVAPGGDPLVGLLEKTCRSRSGLQSPFGRRDELGVPFHWTMGTLTAADAAWVMDAVASVPADQNLSVSRRTSPGPERSPMNRHIQGRYAA